MKFLNFPRWVVPAIAFNNTTSLPLLLTESLGSTGILKRLFIDGDTTESAINRAESYFLVCSIVGNCLTFAIGPRLIDVEHSLTEEEDDTQEEQDDTNGDAEQGHGVEDEYTSLIPQRVRSAGGEAHKRVLFVGKQKWDKLGPRTRGTLAFIFDFFNAPLTGAIIGAVIGLTPPLHRLFFNDIDDGGYLKAWLTSSLKKVGELFVTLQVVVVGVSLSSSLRKMKRGEDQGLPLLPVALVLFTRLVLWPVISIAIIWLLATRTSVLSNDPILWFCMMMMPAGKRPQSLSDSHLATRPMTKYHCRAPGHKACSHG